MRYVSRSLRYVYQAAKRLVRTSWEWQPRGTSTSGPAHARAKGTTGLTGPAPPEKTTLGEVFAVAEFRALLLADVLSVAGDQIARLALSVTVFDRTGSPLLAAVTYAASIIPTSAGGVLLAGLADRFPRRRVMIACDLIRAALVLAMVVPGMPLLALVVLLAAVTFCDTPFMSARAAIYPEVLPGDRYVVGTAVTQTAALVAVVAASAAAGAIVALAGLGASLLVDAASFTASALIIWSAVKVRPAPPAVGPDRSMAGESAIRLVFGTPSLRLPLFLGCLGVFVAVPDALAAPLARASGGGAIGSGLILAASAAGAGAGTVAFSRLLPPTARQAWVPLLALASSAVLIAAAGRPGLPVLLAIVLVSGICSCYQAPCNAAFVAAAPEGRRGQVFGVARATIALTQAAGMAIAGAAAVHFPPAVVVAGSGAVGVVLATGCLLAAGSRGRGVAAPVSGHRRGG